jgi:heavy metal translocating P-type ATPase
MNNPGPSFSDADVSFSSGSSCAVCAEGEGREDEGAAWFRLALASVVAAQSFAFGLAVNLSPPEGHLARWVLHGLLAFSSALVFLLVGGPLCRSAVAALKQKRTSLEQFFLVGIAGAWGASAHCSLTGVGSIYYEVVAVLLAIYTLGHLLVAKQRATALRAAGTLRREFETCHVLDGQGRETFAATFRVGVGDRVVVRAGEGIPVDGEIEQGTALVQQTALTGEPFPVTRRPGDKVLAGCLCLDQRLVIRATVSGTDRRLDKILSSVEAAGCWPLPPYVDRMAALFLPGVLLVALVTAAVWTVQKDWATGIFNALAVIVVACPCALGLATPICLWGAMNALAAQGLLVRRGDAIERMAACTHVVFDKTGTLSHGRMMVADFVVLPDEDRRDWMRQVAVLQSSSPHPVARAMSEWEGELRAGEQLGPVAIVPGAGVQAMWRKADGTTHQIAVGNSLLIQEKDRHQADRLRGMCAGSPQATHEVWVLRDGAPVGMARLSETLRSSVSPAIENIKALGLKVSVWSGDHPAAVASWGWENATGGLSPEDKAAMAQEKERSGERLLWVGDGVNDAPAMAVAHASIALEEGAALSRETADVRLLGGDLTRVPAAIALARHASGLIRSNLRLAVAYNIVGMGCASAGWLHPVVAALIMMASSATVTVRSLRAHELWTRSPRSVSP